MPHLYLSSNYSGCYNIYLLQRSAEFRLPEISLSSLEALLQTITQKLGRKSGAGDGRPQRRVQSDHLLMVEHCFREKRVEQQPERCTEEGNLKKMYVWWFWGEFSKMFHLSSSTSRECGILYIMSIIVSSFEDIWRYSTLLMWLLSKHK